MAVRNRRSVVVPVIGLDVGKPGELIDRRATPDCLNVQITRTVIEKIQGTEQAGESLEERVQALIELEQGSQTFFVRIGNSKVQLFNKTLRTWSDIHHTLLSGDENDRIDHAFPLLGGLRILVFTNNGADPIRKYNGIGNDADLGGNPPRCKFMIDYEGYLLLGYIFTGGNEFFARVQWPDTGDPENWTPGGGSQAGSADLLQDSEGLTGFGLLSDFVTVHKNSSIYIGYLVSTSAVFKFDRKATGAGTVCFATIKSLPTGEQIFLAPDGFRLFNGITAPLIESPITDELREFMNPEVLNKCWSVVVRERDEYWCGVPIGGQTEPETVYKYNYLTRQVYKDSRANISAAGIFKNTVGQLTWDDLIGDWESQTFRWNDVTVLSQNPVVAFGATDGMVTNRSPTRNDDNGVAIVSEWTSKDYTAVDVTGDPDDEGQIIEWQGLQVWALGNSLIVEYSTDSGATWMSAGTLTLGSQYPQDSNPLMVWFTVASSMLRIRVRNTSLGETWKLKKFVFLAVPRGETP